LGRGRDGNSRVKDASFVIERDIEGEGEGQGLGRGRGARPGKRKRDRAWEEGEG
jgi:hypothetical protein